jgi:hypothetical protein
MLLPPLAIIYFATIAISPATAFDIDADAITPLRLRCPLAILSDY